MLVVPHVGQRLPYSRFNKDYLESTQTLRQRILQANERRIRKANNVLDDKLECDLDCLMAKNRNTEFPEFCFVVVSVSRPVLLHFLTQVVASLVPQLTDIDCVFTVYNAEGPSHKEAVNLSLIVPTVGHDKVIPRKSIIIKEREDYAAALEWCQRQRPKFSVILQDDALPPDNFVDHLRFVLDYRMSKNSKKWAFLKLYYPEKWLGWGNERLIILELVLSSLFVGFLFTSVTYIFQSIIIRKISICRVDCKTFIRYVASCTLALYILISFGRPNWIGLRTISHHLSSVVPSPGCCIPGVVYPQTHLHDTIHYIREMKNAIPVDIALDKFAESNGLDMLLVVPNMVKHIGFVSSLGKMWKNPNEFYRFDKA